MTKETVKGIMAAMKNSQLNSKQQKGGPIGRFFHLVSIDDFQSRAQVTELFELADRIKSNPKEFRDALKDLTVATIFFEPSTRTRLSFETAINKIGGHLISTENGGSSSVVKGESIEDTVRTVMGYADAIVMRHPDDDSAARAAKVSTIPIINAGSGKAHHPTQALLDVYTLQQYKGRLDGLKIAVVGDLKYGRTAHSLIDLLSLYNNTQVYGFPVKGLELPAEYIEKIKQSGGSYTHCDNMEQIPVDADALYYTRIQNERLSGEKIAVENYNINAEKIKRFSPDTLIMHPLPRNGEISTDLDNDPRAIYFQQAHNGVPIRQALLVMMLAK